VLDYLQFLPDAERGYTMQGVLRTVYHNTHGIPVVAFVTHECTDTAIIQVASVQVCQPPHAASQVGSACMYGEFGAALMSICNLAELCC
jgi:hypothetical protein